MVFCWNTRNSRSYTIFKLLFQFVYNIVNVSDVKLFKLSDKLRPETVTLDFVCFLLGE